MCRQQQVSQTAMCWKLASNAWPWLVILLPYSLIRSVPDLKSEVFQSYLGNSLLKKNPTKIAAMFLLGKPTPFVVDRLCPHIRQDHLLCCKLLSHPSRASPCFLFVSLCFFCFFENIITDRECINCSLRDGKMSTLIRKTTCITDNKRNHITVCCRKVWKVGCGSVTRASRPHENSCSKHIFLHGPWERRIGFGD